MKRQEARSVGDILNELLKIQQLDSKLNETKLIHAWPQVVGPAIARYTTNLYISRGILYVQLSSAVVRNELSMCRNMLLRQLNSTVGTTVIQNIIFR